MVNLVNLLVATPTGFWANIIGAFESFVVNYAWAIILLTICIKLILSPLDLMNKKVSRDNAKMQQVLGPQLKKLQKQYANDRNTLNQKTSELYKSSGLNMGGSCVVMLVYMALTLVIFISLFTALNTMSSYKIEEQYLQLKDAYYVAYNAEADVAQKETAGQNAVLELYDARDSSFLWVKNIWVADNPWTNAVSTFENYLKTVGDNVRLDITDAESVKYSELDDAPKLAFENEYNLITAPLLEQRNGVNGYLVTAVLAIATAFFSQYLMQRKLAGKKASESGAENPTQQTNKIMLIVLPVVMGLITLFYNAVFGFYIIAGQIVSLFTFPIIDKILDKYYDKKERQKEEKIKVDYRRK